MKFDEETLLEIDDYIEALDESVGLSSETIIDVKKATSRQRRKLKILNKHVVSNRETAVCACGKFIELVDNTQCKKCQTGSSEAKAN